MIRELCLRTGLLYVYFVCSLTGRRDSSPSPRKRRRPTVAAAARAAREEDDEEYTTTRGRGVGHGVARGARRATAARIATANDPDSADSVATLGRGKV